MNRHKPIAWRYCCLALLIIFITILLGPTSRAYAQTEVKILNSTIDGGGGASTGGDFRLRGTIATPDAGPRQGGP